MRSTGVQTCALPIYTLSAGGLRLVTGGTDCHLLLADLRPFNVAGNVAVEALERCGLTANKNAIPFDSQPPTITYGMRLGTPAATSRGFGKEEFEAVGRIILEVLVGLIPGAMDEAAFRNAHVELTERKRVG